MAFRYTGLNVMRQPESLIKDRGVQPTSSQSSLMGLAGSIEGFAQQRKPEMEEDPQFLKEQQPFGGSAALGENNFWKILANVIAEAGGR